jgi:hypothetical protein
VVVRVTLTTDKWLYVSQTVLNRKTNQVTVFRREATDADSSATNEKDLLVIPVDNDWMHGASVTLQQSTSSEGSLAGRPTIFSVHRCGIMRDQNDFGMRFVARIANLQCLSATDIFTFTGFFSVKRWIYLTPIEKHLFALTISRDHVVVKVKGFDAQWSFTRRGDNDFVIPFGCKQ